MLVLSRNIGERIIINDNIIVKIIGVQGAQVRLSIEAPREIPIFREEIYSLVKAQEAPEASIEPR